MATVAEPVPQEHVRHTKTRANFVEKSHTGRNFAENAEEQTVRKKVVTNVVTPNRMANNMGMLVLQSKNIDVVHGMVIYKVKRI